MISPHDVDHLHRTWNSEELYAACASPERSAQIAGYGRLWDYLLRRAVHVVRDQPDAEMLAQDCTQQALIRIHAQIGEVREPKAFLAWTRTIVCNIGIDELRKRRRLVSLADWEVQGGGASSLYEPSPEAVVNAGLNLAQLRRLLDAAPISERSRRVVVGRYFEDVPDEQLAEVESRLAEQAVLPSHIQVTRAKNLAKLRDWEPLRAWQE